MDKIKRRKTVFYGVLGLLALLVVFQPEMVSSFAGYIGSLFLPIVTGLIMAFVLNVPINGFERLFGIIFKNAKKKPKKSTVHKASFFLTIICLLLVITLFATLVIPEVIKTVKAIAASVEKQIPTWISWLSAQGINTDFVKKVWANMDLKDLFEKATTGAGVVIGSIAGTAQSTISALIAFLAGLVIAIYTLLDRDNLSRRGKKLLYAYMKEKNAKKVHKVAVLIKDTYSKFLSGQCIEALILGVLVTVSFLIFRIPYAWLIGMVTAICSLIPYVGAFAAGGFATVLAFLESPQKALICLIIYSVIQIVETQIIYPHVVGGQVGLSPLLTLAAVLVGGKMFGLLGMIFFIPLVAVISELLGINVNRRLKAKNIDVEDLDISGTFDVLSSRDIRIRDRAPDEEASKEE